MKTDNISEFAFLFFMDKKGCIDRKLGMDYLVYGEKYGNPTFDEFVDLWVNKDLQNSKNNYELLISFIDKVISQNNY